METREQLEARLADLRAGRGRATVDGKKFDNSAIAALETQLETLEDANAERVRREREAAQAAHDKELGEKRSRLAALINDDLLDSQAAQEAATILASAFSRKLDRVVAMARLAAEIKRPVPVCLSRPELERRLACRLSAIMHSTLPVNNKRQLGSVLWHPGVHRADEDWRAVDAATFAKHLNPILGKEAPDGDDQS